VVRRSHRVYRSSVQRRERCRKTGIVAQASSRRYLFRDEVL
jgi:hypothetical protein